MKKILSILLVTTLIISACSLNDDEVYLSKIEINGTGPFIIGRDAGRSYDSTSETYLFQMSSDGTLSEVQFLDAAGSPIKTYPKSIIGINSDYFFASLYVEQDYFGDKYTSWQSYLVRIADGSMFLLDNSHEYPSSNFHSFAEFSNSPSFQTDSNGYCYYLSSLGIIKKFSLSNPSSISPTDFSVNNDYITDFKISPDGHAIYKYDNSFRVLKSNGDFYTPASNTSKPFWIGLDGEIHYIDFTNDVNVTVLIDSSNFSVTTNEDADTASEHGSILLALSNRTLFVKKNGNNVYEVENPSNTPRAIALSVFSSISHGDASTQTYYLSGYNSSSEPIFMEVSSADVTTDLIPANTYDIESFVVSDDDFVYFWGTAVSDGTDVIGTIDQIGTVSTKSNSTDTTLEKVISVF